MVVIGCMPRWPCNEWPKCEMVGLVGKWVKIIAAKPFASWENWTRGAHFYWRIIIIIILKNCLKMKILKINKWINKNKNNKSENNN